MIDTTTKIGICGMGVVGKATYNGFSPIFKDIVSYDYDHGTIESMYDRDYIFLCLPASYVEGRQDLCVIYDVVSDIVVGCNKNITFILRSSAVPGSTDRLANTFGYKWCFNPEFLTERTSTLDFINSSRFVLGGDYDGVEKLYRKRFPHTPIYTMSNISAELVKYMSNLFFMTKITFMNEMYQVVDDAGGQWENVLQGFASDGRIGNSHLHVPGFDGKKGFGGKCFPENINNYLAWAQENEIDCELIDTVRKVNNKYRK